MRECRVENGRHAFCVDGRWVRLGSDRLDKDDLDGGLRLDKSGRQSRRILTSIGARLRSSRGTLIQGVRIVTSTTGRMPRIDRRCHVLLQNKQEARLDILKFISLYLSKAFFAVDWRRRCIAVA